MVILVPQAGFEPKSFAVRVWDPMLSLDCQGLLKKSLHILIFFRTTYSDPQPGVWKIVVEIMNYF